MAYGMISSKAIDRKSIPENVIAILITFPLLKHLRLEMNLPNTITSVKNTTMRIILMIVVVFILNRELSNQYKTIYVNQILLFREMPIEDFSILDDLGKGSFGSVVKVTRKQDNSVYAMKQIKLQRLKEKDKKNSLNEIRFLASIKHPNIVTYRQAFYDEETECLCVVMDFANEGDLSRKIKKHLNAKVRIKEEVIWKVAYELLEGLNKLHDCNIIHRDLKPANIFFNNGSAQIGDLNVAKHLKDQFTVTQTGTPYYASPEVWSQEPYEYKSDIWSLGCVLYEMAVLKPPFRADTPQKLFKKILSGVYDPLPSVYSKQLQKFIQKLLVVNQKHRCSTKQLLCQPKMMDLKDEACLVFEGHQDKEEKLLIGTINFPKNLKMLNGNLPKSEYEVGQAKKCKTAKIIKLCNDTKQRKESSKKATLIPSLKLITSEKKIAPDNIKSMKDIIPNTQTGARKPKVLNKNPSQKLIF